MQNIQVRKATPALPVVINQDSVLKTVSMKMGGLITRHGLVIRAVCPGKYPARGKVPCNIKQQIRFCH